MRVGKNFESLEPELIAKFQQFDWPGNVRELKQAIERLAFHYDGPVMRAAWWDAPPRPAPLGASPAGAPGSVNAAHAVSGHTGVLTLAALPPSRRGRQGVAKRLLQETSEDLAWVAAQVGVHPTTLYRWRKEGKV